MSHGKICSPFPKLMCIFEAVENCHHVTFARSLFSWLISFEYSDASHLDSSALSTDEPSSMAEVSAHSKLVTKKSVKDEPSVTKSKKNGRVVASRLMETTASRRAKTIGLVRRVRPYKNP